MIELKDTQQEEILRRNHFIQETFRNSFSSDLFDKRSSKEKLLNWIKGKHYVKTSEILKWGTENYSNRADRNARQLAKDGRIRRLDFQEKIMRFGKIKEEVYEFVR